MRCANEKALAGFVAGLVEPEAAAALREHLEHCPRCRDIQTRMAATIARLAPDPGELDAPDLVGSVMASLSSTAARPQPSAVRPRPRLAWLWLPMAAAAATALLLVARPFLSSDGTEGFHRRGGALADPDRWVSVEVFRATAAGYQRVADRIATNDALAFAYVNLGDEGFRYLNLLAVDGEGDVFWYYPAREAGGGQPIARIPRGELPDEIRHQLHAGSLRMFAVFSQEPRDRALLEQIVRRDLREARSVQNLRRLRLEGTGQHTLLLTVTSPLDAGAAPGVR